jgi:hypothetical protein
MRIGRRRARRNELQVRRPRGLAVIDPSSHNFRAPALVDAMIEYARTNARNGVELVQTTFNDITIIVAARSDRDLIMRDYYRTFVGHRARTMVGPYPEPEVAGLERYTKEALGDPDVWNILRPQQSSRL